MDSISVWIARAIFMACYELVAVPLLFAIGVAVFLLPEKAHPLGDVVAIVGIVLGHVVLGAMAKQAASRHADGRSFTEAFGDGLNEGRIYLAFLPIVGRYLAPRA